MASQLASTQAIAMSSFRREHVSPSEFTALVQSYYKAREPYDKLFKQYLDSQNKMPHHDAEESTHGDLTDKVAKESTDSTASSHENHDVDHSHATSGGSSGKATSQDHKSTPGPVMSSNLGTPATREELKARSDELNKSS